MIWQSTYAAGGMDKDDVLRLLRDEGRRALAQHQRDATVVSHLEKITHDESGSATIRRVILGLTIPTNDAEASDKEDLSSCKRMLLLEGWLPVIATADV